MHIFAFNMSKFFMNQDTIDLLNKLGKATITTEKMSILDVPEILDPETDKIMLISPLFIDWKLENETIDKIPNLKAIFITSTSYSWFDTAYCASKGIPVFNGGSYSTNAVAEGAMLLAMNTARKLPLMMQNNWTIDYAKHLGQEITKKKAGIVGLGSIGTRIAQLAKGWDMDVQYWSRNSRDENYTYKELTELFSTSDYLFVTLAANKETETLLTDELLMKMRPTTVLVNIAHKIFNEKLVIDMVRDGKLYGYANVEADRIEGNADGNIWEGLPFIWYTQESIARNIEIVMDYIEKFIKAKDTTGKIN